MNEMYDPKKWKELVSSILGIDPSEIKTKSDMDYYINGTRDFLVEQKGKLREFELKQNLELIKYLNKLKKTMEKTKSKKGGQV